MDYVWDDLWLLEGVTNWIIFGIYVKCLAFAGWEEIVMVSLRVTDVAKA